MIKSPLSRMLFRFCYPLHKYMDIIPRDGVIVRASASQSVDLRFISQVESKQKTLQNDIHRFPAWSSANRDSVEN